MPRFVPMLPTHRRRRLPSFCTLLYVFICLFCCCSPSPILTTTTTTTFMTIHSGGIGIEGRPSFPTNSVLGWLFLVSKLNDFVGNGTSAAANVANGTSAANVGNGTSAASVGNGTSAANDDGVPFSNAAILLRRQNNQTNALNFAMLKLRKVGKLEPLNGVELYLLVSLLISLCSAIVILALCCWGWHQRKCQRRRRQMYDVWRRQRLWRASVQSRIPRVSMPPRHWLSADSSAATLGRMTKFAHAQPYKIAEI